MTQHVNKVELIGKLMNNELKYTTGGKPVCNFTLYTEIPYGKEGKSLKEWSRCVSWNDAEKIGEMAENSIIKVIGRNATRKWQDKDGNSRWTTEVICNEVELIESESQPEPATNEPPQDDPELPF